MSPSARAEAKALVVETDLAVQAARGKVMPNLFTSADVVVNRMIPVVNPPSALSDDGVLQFGLRIDRALDRNKPATSHYAYFAKRKGAWVELRAPNQDEMMAIIGWVDDGHKFRPEQVSPTCTLLRIR